MDDSHIVAPRPNRSFLLLIETTDLSIMIFIWIEGDLLCTTAGCQAADYGDGVDGAHARHREVP
jgi:hypothetical protein